MLAVGQQGDPMRKALTYLGISMGLSFAFATAYVVVRTLTLPKTDLAYGKAPFQDPLVLPVMAMVAGVSGIVGWPLFAALGWHSSPAKVVTVVGLTTLLFIIVATPIRSSVGWYGSYVVCVAALLYCRLRCRSALGQPAASPNGGPAAPTGNSGVSEGPPSVS